MGFMPIPKSHCPLKLLESGLGHLYANAWGGIYIQSAIEVSISVENGEFFMFSWTKKREYCCLDNIFKA